MRVLLLNASHEPLHVVAARRAIGLMLDGKAEILESGPEPIRSESMQFHRPSVIRLCRYRSIPFASVVPLSTRAVLSRDGYRCRYCGGKATTVDHVVPRSRPGGDHVWENVVAACVSCNQRKGDRLLGEIGWSLDYSPVRPTGAVARLLVQVRNVDPLWVPYLGVAA